MKQNIWVYFQPQPLIGLSKVCEKTGSDSKILPNIERQSPKNYNHDKRVPKIIDAIYFS